MRPYHDPETARNAEWFVEPGEFFTDDGMEIAWHDEFNGIWSSASLARLAGGWRTYTSKYTPHRMVRAIR